MSIKPSSYTVTMYSVYCNKCGRGVIKDIPYKTKTVTCPACGESFELDWGNWDVSEHLAEDRRGVKQ